MAGPRVYVCTGKDCCGQSDAHRALVKALKPVGHLEKVRCQKVCDGPVVGVEVGGRLEWFERLRKPKARQALVDLVADGRGELPKPLVKRRVRWKSGKGPR